MKRLIHFLDVLGRDESIDAAQPQARVMLSDTRCGKRRFLVVTLETG